MSTVIVPACARHDWHLFSYGSTTGQYTWQCSRCYAQKITFGKEDPYAEEHAATQQQEGGNG